MRLPLHCRVDGPTDGDVLVLGPSLGTSLRMWDAQVSEFASEKRVIRYDLPGHSGLSDVDVDAVTVDDIAQNLLAIADACAAPRFDYAGVSLGGAVGQWLALHYPHRLRRLALLCTSAYFGPAESWRERSQLVAEQGVAALVEPSEQRWFAPGFRERDPQRVEALLADLRQVGSHGYRACCAAIGAFDVRSELPNISVPTLVIAGEQDVAAPVPHGQELADGIPDARLAVVPQAGHLANAEQPHTVTALLREHFRRDVPDGATGRSDEQRLAEGFVARRQVLGTEYVDAAIANTTALTEEFQDLITRYAWGEIWTRPGLDRKTRSAITVTALVAHGHLDELAIHIRGALRNGLTRREIAEVLMQSAIYCGVPAANSAFKVANRVLAEP